MNQYAAMTRSKPPTRRTPDREIATLRIELLHSRPLVWRQLEVPTSATLEALHDMIQAAMGWHGAHLWEFEIDGRTYGLPDDDGVGEPVIDADGVTLRDILKPRKTSFDYRYDFGDNWELRLTLTAPRAREPRASYPRYIGGERNAPPEDCGGIPGFDHLLDALADPTDSELSDILEWVGEYDPARIDEAAIRAALDRLDA